MADCRDVQILTISLNGSVIAVVARSPRYHGWNTGAISYSEILYFTWVLRHRVAQVEVEERVEEEGHSPQT